MNRIKIFQTGLALCILIMAMPICTWAVNSQGSFLDSIPAMNYQRLDPPGRKSVPPTKQNQGTAVEKEKQGPSNPLPLATTVSLMASGLVGLVTVRRRKN